MAFTTPPRPLDITAVFPELRNHSGTATRLHPRPGEPTARDSSVGGPLLWPAGEPWPVCTDADHHLDRLLRPEQVRRTRRIQAAAENRPFTAAEQAELAAYDFSEPESLAAGPIPLVPVAQLYRHDVPGFIGPADADLLQVLWCPLDHPDLGYNPRPEVRWRRAREVTDPLLTVPEPVVVYEDYLPTPCRVHPEVVCEFQYGGLLPDDLETRLEAWEEATGTDYQGELSIAPGWKLGGFASWSLTDAYAVDCAACGTPMTLLLTAASAEWEDGSSWRPVEEPPGSSTVPTDVVIGRGYDYYLFRCPLSFDHPPAVVME